MCLVTAEFGGYDLIAEHGGQALVAAESVGDVEGQLQRLLSVQPGILLCRSLR